MSTNELLRLLAEARIEGWYEEDPGWRPIDDELVARGLATRTRVNGFLEKVEP